MAFSVNMTRPGIGTSRKFNSGGSGRASLIVLSCVFAAFCIFDYSPYGYGIVAEMLGGSQRWFQGLVGSFRIRM